MKKFFSLLLACLLLCAPLWDALTEELDEPTVYEEEQEVYAPPVDNTATEENVPIIENDDTGLIFSDENGEITFIEDLNHFIDNSEEQFVDEDYAYNAASVEPSEYTDTVWNGVDQIDLSEYYYDGVEESVTEMPVYATESSDYKTAFWIYARYRGGLLHRLWFKKEPYAASENAGSIPGGLFKGAAFDVIRFIENDYGNLWAETVDHTFIYAGYKKNSKGEWIDSPPDDLGQSIYWDDSLYEKKGRLYWKNDNLSGKSFVRGNIKGYKLEGILYGKDYYNDMPYVRVKIYDTGIIINGKAKEVYNTKIKNTTSPRMAFFMSAVTQQNPNLFDSLPAGKYEMVIMPTYLSYVGPGHFAGYLSADEAAGNTKEFQEKNALVVPFDVVLGAENTLSSSITFSNIAYPSTYVVGTPGGYALTTGEVNSTYSLTSLKSEIIRADGQVISSYTRPISGNNYQIKEMDTYSSDDNGVKFSYISEPGDYIWVLTATDSVGYSESIEMAFKAVSEGSSTDNKTGSDTGSLQSEQWTYTVVTPDGLNMRDSASTSGALVTTLWNPTTVTVTKKQSADGYTWGYGTSSDGYTGWIVVDNNWTTLTSSSADTPAPSHTHTPVTDAAIAATCTESGKTEGSHCSTCGEILTAQQTIPATGHQEITVKGIAATCTQEGLTDGSKCSVCGTILKAQQTIPAAGHKPTTVKGTAVTCAGAGLTEGSVCAVCGAVLVAQESVAALAHTPVTDPAVAPTYTSAGLTEGSHCAVCGAVLVAQQPVAALDYPQIALTKVKKNGTVTLAVGDIRQIVPAFATDSGLTVTGYKSSKAKVASIDGNGLLTANAEGKTKITVTTANKKKKATLTVKVVDPYKPTKVSIAQGKSIQVTMGEPLQLNAVLAPESARATLTWASNKPKVARVDGNGLVTPVGEGKAKITVRTQNKKKATITVQVVDPNKPLGIAIAQGKTVTMKVGESLQLGVGLNPATAQSALTWKTNKPAIATVDGSGVVTAVKKGKAKITVMTYNKKKATIAVNVVE